MIEAAKALEEHGAIPPGVDEPEVYRQRSGGVILPRDVNWWDGTEKLRTMFSATVDRSAQPVSAS